MEISARNESFRTDIPDRYVYAQCYHCWGWATWRRAWEKMDMQMKAAPKLSCLYLIRRLGLIRGYMMKRYFMQAYHSLPNFNSWATKWYLAILAHDGLVICPGVNLAINIGMDGGTHYDDGDEDPFAKLTIGKIQWPICYDDRMLPDKIQKESDSLSFIKMRKAGIKKKIIEIFK
ncbi:hypothetical protein SDC9_140799 [bioreactor metagenome]|uniref:Uncharacterized protein n=1 Tax=bioreactor metagenome TaxID=1076179 RepID=A0A645DWJ2_9ZZZZ